MTIKLPWPKAVSHYDSDGPRGALAEFDALGARIRVSPSGDEGIHTSRARYRVECLTCPEIIHKSTTGPTSRVWQHMKDAHDYDGEFEHTEMK